MSETTQCQSCSMTIENGTYCQYCTDEGGSLVAFGEALERFMQFAMQRDTTMDRNTAKSSTLEFMAQQPAWAEHPELAKARSGN